MSLVSLRLENVDFEEAFMSEMEEGDGILCIDIYLDKVDIGGLVCQYGNEELYIESISLDENYRGKHYGTKAIEELKRVSKKFGFKYIEAECTGSLINFYTKLGADFKPRCKKDLEYSLNRFYIDL